jgi:hypothetical protein
MRGEVMEKITVVGLDLAKQTGYRDAVSSSLPTGSTNVDVVGESI